MIRIVEDVSIHDVFIPSKLWIPISYMQNRVITSVWDDDDALQCPGCNNSDDSVIFSY